MTHTLACYHAIIAARVFDHGLLEEMARVNAAPVLNMLSGTDHPLQALADLLTIKQLLGRLEGAKIAFIGEGNNVSRSLAEACALVGAKFTIASPEGYGLPTSSAFARSSTPSKRSKAPTSSTPTSGCRWAAKTATSAARRSSRTRSMRR